MGKVSKFFQKLRRGHDSEAGDATARTYPESVSSYDVIERRPEPERLEEDGSYSVGDLGMAYRPRRPLDDSPELLALEPYTYSPLTPGRNIRVLELFGGDGYDDVLKMRLAEVSLDTNPSFCAISYCWEGQTPTQNVICDGRRLLVTVNCEAALRRFRKRERYEMILLWIDGICINQLEDGTREKSHQVAMMGAIYEAAEQVWVWLGSSELHDIDPAYIRVLQWIKELDDAVQDPDRESARKRVESLAHQIDDTRLSNLLRVIPWFRRIWVIQEVALSKASVLYWDEIEISSHRMSHASYLMSIYSKSTPRISNVDYWLYQACRAFHLAEQFESGEETISFFINWAMKRHAWDPRDKILALHTLLQKANPSLPLPPPDYSKTAAQIYHETMVYFLNDKNNFELLRMACGFHNSDYEKADGTYALPSWVPDWSTSTIPIVPYHTNQQGFQSTADSAPVFSLDDDGKTLKVQGKIIDTISSHSDFAFPHTSERFGDPEKYLEWSQNAHPKENFWKDVLANNLDVSEVILRFFAFRSLRGIIDFALGPDPLKRSPESRIELYSALCSRSGEYSEALVKDELALWDRWLSLITLPSTARRAETQRGRNSGARRQSTTRPAITPQGLARYFGGLVDSYRRRRNEPLIASLLKTEEFKVLEALSENNELANLQDKVEASLHYQSVFRTRSNKLGMGPHSIKAGDKIALFSGVGYPMTVRPQGNRYRLVAPAYVYGFMWSEAWKSDADGQLVLQDIELV